MFLALWRSLVSVWLGKTIHLPNSQIIENIQLSGQFAKLFTGNKTKIHSSVTSAKVAL